MTGTIYPKCIRTDGPLVVGAVQLVEIANQFWVANCIVDHGAQFQHQGPGLILNKTLEISFKRLASMREHLPGGAVLAIQRLGGKFRGIDWHLVEPIVATGLVASGLKVTVFDL